MMWRVCGSVWRRDEACLQCVWRRHDVGVDEACLRCVWRRHISECMCFAGRRFVNHVLQVPKSYVMPDHAHDLWQQTLSQPPLLDFMHITRTFLIKCEWLVGFYVGNQAEICVWG